MCIHNPVIDPGVIMAQLRKNHNEHSKDLLLKGGRSIVFLMGVDHGTRFGRVGLSTLINVYSSTDFDQ